MSDFHRNRRTAVLLGAAALALLAAPALTGCPRPPARARFTIDENADFFAAPFPIFTRVRGDGTIRWGDFPNPDANPIAAAYIDAADTRTRGFSTNGGVFFPLTEALDSASLPADPTASTSAGASVYLMDVDPGSPERGRRIPIAAHFRAKPGKYRPPNLLTLLPVQGYPLRAETLYAAVVTRGVRDALGHPIPVVPEVVLSRLGVAPVGPRGAEMVALYRNLWETLAAIGEGDEEVAVATVYRTMDPVGEQVALGEFVRSQPPPVATDLFRIRDHQDYCVLEGRVDMPIFQSGERPYLLEGGEILFDDHGAPIVQWTESVRFALTVPRGVMPATGWPVLIFANGSGGSYLSVVDRGAQPLPPLGSGPASFLAARGIAAIATDPILTGPRSPDHDPSGTLFFNPLNPFALRDNTRQSAAEVAVLASLVENLEVDPSLCDGDDVSRGPSGKIGYDADRILFMSQSQGSTLAPNAIATERRIKAAVLSGAGLSAIYTMNFKKAPFDVREAVSILIGIWPFDKIDVFEPAVTLLQTVFEPAEGLNFVRHFAAEPLLGGAPQHTLVISGIFDSYVPVEQNDALAAGLGADLVGPVVYPPTLDVIGLGGHGAIAPPVALNNTEGPSPVTAGVVQYPAPEGFDGHFVTFQLDAPKHQYGCFLQSFVESGVPVIPLAASDPFAPCFP
ncbi:MAG: hypothetical protein KC466_08925 [Myxococcales bacterium]|nr:hypothetical protein [Myxococcales bacterium]